MAKNNRFKPNISGDTNPVANEAELWLQAALSQHFQVGALQIYRHEYTILYIK
jgi:hypothetical protein